MVSESAVRSHNVAKEVMLTSERKGHILPVHLEPTQIPPGLKYPLAGIQHIEYFHGDAAREPEDHPARARTRRRGAFTRPPRSRPRRRACRRGTARPRHGRGTAPSRRSRRAPSRCCRSTTSAPTSETDYFSDGLTEELIARLSLVSEIELVSRWASMQFKGAKQDIRRSAASWARATSSAAACAASRSRSASRSSSWTSRPIARSGATPTRASSTTSSTSRNRSRSRSSRR